MSSYVDEQVVIVPFHVVAVQLSEEAVECLLKLVGLVAAERGVRYPLTRSASRAGVARRAKLNLSSPRCPEERRPVRVLSRRAAGSREW